MPEQDPTQGGEKNILRSTSYQCDAHGILRTDIHVLIALINVVEHVVSFTGTTAQWKSAGSEAHSLLSTTLLPSKHKHLRPVLICINPRKTVDSLRNERQRRTKGAQIMVRPGPTRCYCYCRVVYMTVVVDSSRVYERPFAGAFSPIAVRQQPSMALMMSSGKSTTFPFES